IVCAYRKNFTVLSLLRRIITRVGITAASLSLPPHARAVKDPLSGAFAGKMSSLKPYLLAEKGFSPRGFKFLYRLLKILPPGIKISQTGYYMKKRTAGKSKMGYRQLKIFFKALSPGVKKMFYGAEIIFMLTAGAFIVLTFGDGKAIFALIPLLMLFIGVHCL
ncbi:MAG: hypothetical protein ACQESB_06355, partial [Elusimicrobiota bacterium]